MNLVNIYLSLNPADAQLVRSRLEAAGFHASIANELSALSIEGYALSAGGIDVRVPESEAAEAREYLNSSIPSPNDTETEEGPAGT
jgi:hypothetical protein